MARTLEREWNERLTEVAALEREYAALPQLTPGLVSPEERQHILALAQDVPTVWHATSTTQTERKQLLRYLVKDVTLTKRATTISIAIRWQTDACTTLEIERPLRSCDKRRTNGAVVERIRQLAPTHTDGQIAAPLNQEGYHPGLGGMFRREKVQWVRWRYHLPKSCPDQRQRTNALLTVPRPDGRYSARAAAAILNVDVSTIADWCKTGRLEYLQEAPHHPRWITLTSECIAVLRKPVRQRKSRRSPS